MGIGSNSKDKETTRCGFVKWFYQHDSTV
ncbi:TPA: hypothetical protein U5E00_003847 [Yersinia enterocolitica]|nr:hypothetical protein [Yersinia enterocolitica]EMA9489947.1 hypothetical protein [Yersinia enterocolitica]HDL7101273.1 hypothetical protein [Yersinia enterocolitica]HDL7947571.1 hypothetical protein [Yersinia enterocolitica]HDV7148648.1 hypothetical protein [Yersinia enterocolitica]